MARQLHLSVIVLLFLQETGSDGIASSCSIPPAEDGGTTVLTCKFDTNIYETKDGFQVERYSTAKNKQESLLACQWISDKLECHLHASVQFNRNISNTFQMDIPFVTSDDFGEYVCHVLPTSNVISKRCYLTSIDNNATTENTTLMATPTSIPETSNDGSDGVALIIASVSMAAVGILIVMKIGRVVHARLNQNQNPEDANPEDANYYIEPTQHSSYTPLQSEDTVESYDKYLHPQQEGVKNARLNQNQDLSNPTRTFRPLPAEPVTSKVVDNISPTQHGGVDHARRKQNQDSSNRTRQCKSAGYPFNSKNIGGVEHARRNQNKDSSNRRRQCKSAGDPSNSKNIGVVHDQLNQEHDSSKPPRRVRIISSETHSSEETSSDEGVKNARLNQNQDLSNPTRTFRPLPQEPSTYEDVDNISPPEDGIIVLRSRPNQKEDSSKPSSRCTAVPAETCMDYVNYDDILPPQHD